MKASFGSGLLLGSVSVFTAASAEEAGAEKPAYPPEEIYDTAVGSDEALVNVRLVNNRWPDCTTLRTAIMDIFRLEGVKDGRGEEKALALWKWFRILVSSTGGAYAYEGPRRTEKIVHGPHKIFTVYGHHQCDGLSWAMVPLWRAAGYIALDECTHGHTTAALRYRDHDGKLRYHSFDPQRRYYYWDDEHKWVGTRTVPVMRGMVYRHLTAPQRLHSLRTSLRTGETIERKWTNEGHVIPSGRDKREAEEKPYYAYEPGKKKGIYACVGEEVQTLEADVTPGNFADALYEGSRNAACSPPAEGKAALHPERADELAEFIYRLAPPYVIADAVCEAALLKGEDADVCRLSISVDGRRWRSICEKEKTGEETVRINIGKEAHRKRLPDVYTAYSFFVKAEFKTSGDVRKVGMNRLKLLVHRMLNKRTLPNLRPGENYLRVTADRLAEDAALELQIDYSVKGNPHRVTRYIRRFPYYFRIRVPGAAERILRNYDQDFNNGDLQMSSIRMRLLPAEVAGESERSLEEVRVLPRFGESSPHPADMTHRKTVKKPETDHMQTSGFFPQETRLLDDDEAMNAFIRRMHGNSERHWRAVEDAGAYPKALDALLLMLPRANIDQTLFICKGLARIGDRRALGPLLKKWATAPRGAPGTRYIPDALAAIGDRKAVPNLIAPLKRCRFDFRFHIAHALGILGGPRAREALEDLARHDPLRGVREEAKRALERIKRGNPPPKANE